MKYIFAPIFSSLAGISVTFMLIFSSIYLAGNKPVFLAFFSFFMALTFFVYILKRDMFLFKTLKNFWGWSLFLCVMFSIGLWRYYVYNAMLSAGLDDKQMILWAIKDGTAVPMQHFLNCIYWIAMFFVFVLSVRACKRKNFKKSFILLFFILITIISFYGLCVYFTGNQYILWFKKTGYIHVLTATFINRNSFALFASCGFLSGVYLLQTKFQKFSQSTIDIPVMIKIFNIVKYFNISRIIYIFSLMIIMAAVILTDSRAGITLMLLSTGVFYLLTLRTNHNTNYLKYRKYIMLFVIILVVIIAPIFLYNYLGRLIHSERDFTVRLNTYIITLNMILERPFIGFGLGSFEYVFQYYRDETYFMAAYWDKAHCTFIEIASEIGIPATICMVLGYGYLYCSMIYSYLKKNSPLMLLYLLLIAIIVLHSCIDFSLQMPAITILFHIIFASGYSMIKNEDVREHKKNTAYSVLARSEGV